MYKGQQLALAQDLPGIVAVLMGVITATFGGVLRDVVCNEIPTAFSDHRPYAICAFIGVCVPLLAPHAGLAARPAPPGAPAPPPGSGGQARVRAVSLPACATALAA